MISFYLAQDNRPARRGAGLLRWLVRWSWLPLLLLLMLGLGALGGWSAHDRYGEDGGGVAAAAECEPCREGPAAAKEMEDGTPAAPPDLASGGGVVIPIPPEPTPTPREPSPTPTLSPWVLAALLQQWLPATPTAVPPATPLPTPTPTPTPTAEPTETPLPTLASTPAPAATPPATPLPTLTASPTPTPISTPTPTPVLTPTPSPDAPPAPRVRAYWTREHSEGAVARAEYERVEDADYYQWYVEMETCSGSGTACEVDIGSEQRQPEAVRGHEVCEELEGARVCYRTSEWSVSYAGLGEGGRLQVEFQVRWCRDEGECSDWGSDALNHSPTPTLVPGVCERTDKVKDGLSAAIGKRYEDITEEDLARVGTLAFGGEGMRELQTCDFEGLSGLEFLDLQGNQLSALPEDVFDGLSSLEFLDLNGNLLSWLPEDVFDGLSSLEVLWLTDNKLIGLPEDVFDGLSSLEVLEVPGNRLSGLPEDVFDGLSSLEWLDLDSNRLSALPEGVFDGLSSLLGLGVLDNPGAPFDLDELERKGVTVY